METRSWNLVLASLASLALAGVLGNPLAVTAADPPPADVKPAAAPPAPPPKPATIKSAMADVGDISAEVRKIEKRLASIDQSVAAISESVKHVESIDKTLVTVSSSLVPVGALTRPEGLDAIVKDVSDVAYGRGVALIFVATGCMAVLLVLFAFLVRWVRRSP